MIHGVLLRPSVGRLVRNLPDDRRHALLELHHVRLGEHGGHLLERFAQEIVSLLARSQHAIDLPLDPLPQPVLRLLDGDADVLLILTPLAVQLGITLPPESLLLGGFILAFDPLLQGVLSADQLLHDDVFTRFLVPGRGG
uniref:Uncharacterized protein n=1 Tax=Anopheles atroparvus TaxID=41427 RepID=A0AAG5CPQ6_ANOAO